MAEPISDEALITALEARGFTVAKKENELSQRLEALEAEIKELRETESAQPPQDPEQTFAQDYARALDRARSKWFSPADERGPDAA